MDNELRDRYLSALEMAQANIGNIADGTGRGYSTLHAYKSGERAVTVAAARSLADYLRRRARKFMDAAAQLEEATMQTTTRSKCIEVRRSDTGIYEVPGAATPEDWQEVQETFAQQGATLERFGDLLGWGEWTGVYRVEDADGLERFYFVREGASNE